MTMELATNDGVQDNKDNNVNNSNDYYYDADDARSEFEWEDDPNVFIFHHAKAGKTKMHVFPLDLTKDWIRIDQTYPDQMKMRYELLRDQRDQVVVTTGSAQTKACEQELLELLFDHLPQRFPTIFELLPEAAAAGGGGASIYNRVTNETVKLVDETGESALVRAARLTQEDWCIMEEVPNGNGGYMLTSGVVCFPMKWSLVEKFRMSMEAIHEPVKVFKKHLQSSAYKVMQQMKGENPIWRANWSIFNDLDGPMDLYKPEGQDDDDDNDDRSKKKPNRVTPYRGEATGRDLIFRAEYQTLRKLPRTRCIVFGIRSYQRYLQDIPVADRPALVAAIKGLDQDMVEYKCAQLWRVAAIKYLTGEKHKDGAHRQWLMPVVVLVLAVSSYYIVSTVELGRSAFV